ncbi:MAG: ATP-binding cassette domain-containing protein, partial [Actinomycetota bacterium]
MLDGVDFDVRRGEVVTLLGPNGAGKTTTIEILEGFRMRSAGEVTVLGPNGAGKTTTIEILEGYRMRDAGMVSVLGVDPANCNADHRERVG